MAVRASIRAALVVALSGLTTACFAATASAAAADSRGPAWEMRGGCAAFVSGREIALVDADSPLALREGDEIVLAGRAPEGVVAGVASTVLRSTTTFTIHLVENRVTRTETRTATGREFGHSVGVREHLAYASGLYRVDISSVAPGAWNCESTIYVEVHGSRATAGVAAALAVLGAGGVVLAKGGRRPVPPEDAPPPPGVVGDRSVRPPDTLAEAQRQGRLRRDRGRNALTDAEFGGLAAAAFAVITMTPAFAAAAVAVGALAVERDWVVWVRGRAFAGFVSGLALGLGATVLLQQRGAYPLDGLTTIVAPLVVAVIGGLRGWLGSAWRVE